MNAYVGAANARPDSRSPRRFTAVSSTTIPTQIDSVCGARPGNADTRFDTPEVTDTDTVRM